MWDAEKLQPIYMYWYSSAYKVITAKQVLVLLVIQTCLRIVVTIRQNYWAACGVWCMYRDLWEVSRDCLKVISGKQLAGRVIDFDNTLVLLARAERYLKRYQDPMWDTINFVFKPWKNVPLVKNISSTDIQHIPLHSVQKAFAKLSNFTCLAWLLTGLAHLPMLFIL